MHYEQFYFFILVLPSNEGIANRLSAGVPFPDEHEAVGSEIRYLPFQNVDQRDSPWRICPDRVERPLCHATRVGYATGIQRNLGADSGSRILEVDFPAFRAARQVQRSAGKRVADTRDALVLHANAQGRRIHIDIADSSLRIVPGAIEISAAKSDPCNVVRHRRH
jgi:hypothetical protein